MSCSAGAPNLKTELNAIESDAVVAACADPRPLFVGSDIFRQAAFGANHPLSIVRHAAVLDLVRILGWLPRQDFHVIQPAAPELLLRFHDRSYIEALQYADSTGRVEPEMRKRYHIGTLENPLFPGLYERAAATVAGSVMAAEMALQGHVAFHPSGGTHHGRRDRACGFCYFNDPVFAILTLLEGGRSRVLYVDLDAHHGDGVEDAFADETRVMTISIHEQDRWPYSGSVEQRQNGFARNLPVPRGFSDCELDFLLDNAVLPLAAEFRADALVIVCGADGLAGDPLSGMQLTNVGLWRAVQKLLTIEQPTVVLGGGGYNPWTVTRCWAGLWGILSHQDFPNQLPGAAVELLRGLECDLIDDEDVDAAWLTTIADAVVDSPYKAPPRKAIESLAATVTS